MAEFHERQLAELMERGAGGNEEDVPKEGRERERLDSSEQIGPGEGGDGCS